jgi:hypothetical protein
MSLIMTSVTEALPPAPGTYEIKAEVWRDREMLGVITENRRWDGKEFSNGYAEECWEEYHLITHWRAL